jgi:hypothetical protein
MLCDCETFVIIDTWKYKKINKFNLEIYVEVCTSVWREKKTKKQINNLENIENNFFYKITKWQQVKHT